MAIGFAEKTLSRVANNVVVRRVSHPTTRMIEVDSVADVLTPSGTAVARVLPDVEGAFVKLRPVLRASERASWDGGAMASRLREHGARGVVLAPVVVPDEGRLSEVARADSPTAAVEAWFASMPGVDPEDRDAARETALRYLAEDVGR